MSRLPPVTDLHDRVQVWLLDPAEATDRLPWLYGWLAQDERQRAERRHQEEDRRLFVVAHALARWSLSQVATKISPADWVLVAGNHGKPEVVQPREWASGRLRYNLSHTAGLVACAVTVSVDCGVDVERIDRSVDHERLGRRVLTDRERDDVAQVPADRRTGRFMAYWTVKEAYLKARGDGLSLPPSAVDLTLPEIPQDRLADVTACLAPSLADSPLDWRLAVGTMSSGHVLAVAVRAPERQLTVQRVRVESLLRP